MRLAWATDIHLNFVSKEDALVFCKEIYSHRPQGFFLTGDIAEGVDVVQWLEFLSEKLPCPIYFVLGNHDYYHSSIATIREKISELDGNHSDLIWLGDGKVISLTEGVALLGHGGWGDARAGDFMSTPIRLNDHRLIMELTGLPREVLMRKLHDLGDEAASILRKSINEAMRWARRILVLTHVPPFLGSCWYQGKAGGDDRWTPDFVCMATGQVLLEAATANPTVCFEVFCGHTHNEGIYKPLPNLVIRTGGAEYKRPQLQEVFSI